MKAGYCASDIGRSVLQKTRQLFSMPNKNCPDTHLFLILYSKITIA